MANRTVSVKLQADVGSYKRGMAEAEKATDRVDDAIDDLVKNPGLDKAGESARRFGRATGDARDKASADFAEISKHATELDRRIRDTEAGIKSLAKGFANTGDFKIVAAMKEEQRKLSDLKNIRKLLPEPAEILGAGQKMGATLAQGVGENMTRTLPVAMNPAVIAGGAAAAVALGPLLGAAAAGGIIGGTAGMGIIGGITIAAKDQRVAAAAKTMGNNIMGQLQDAALPFVDATMDAIAILESRFNQSSTRIRSIMANAATFVRPLAEGVGDFLDPVIRGIDALMANARPVIEAIKTGLASVGRAVGDVFESLADNGEAAGMAISVVFEGVASAIRIVGAVINGLTEAFGWLITVADKLGMLSDEGKQKLNEMRAATDGASGSGKGATSSFGSFKEVIEETGKAAKVTKTEFKALDEQIQGIVDRNLSAAEANIALRGAIASAAEAVDKKRKVSDEEATALIGLARQANTTTKALDDQGRTVQEATRSHEANRKKLIETAIRMGYTKTEAKRLADQYLATPKNVNTRIGQPGMPTSQKEAKAYDEKLDAIARQINTSIKVTGDREAGGKLDQLLIRQQALKKGISVSSAASAFNKNAYAEGGHTGPGPKMQPAGVVHADEFVIKKSSRQRIERRAPGLLNEMNATGQVPNGYAAGGRVLNAPFPVNATVTKVMTLAEALSKVAPSFGNWPSSPGAQRGDSGIWRRIVAMIRGTGPMSGSFGNGYRPGDPLWHGSGRAVDWMGYNQDRLASFLAAKKPLELIHRTKNRDYAYTRGRNMGSFNASLMNAHRNHIHIAMANGGVIGEPVFGVGASGATYSFGERGPETVTPGVGGGPTVVNNITVAPRLTPNMHPREVGRQIAEYLQPYLAAGGEINVRGATVLSAS